MLLTPSQIRALETGQRLDERMILAQNPQFQAGIIQSAQQYQTEQFRQRLEQQQKTIQNLLHEISKQQAQMQALKNFTIYPSLELNANQKPSGHQYFIPRYNHDQYKQLAQQLLLATQQDQNKHYFKSEITPSSNEILVENNYANQLDTSKEPAYLQQEIIAETPVKALFSPNHEYLKDVQGQPQETHQAHFVFDPMLEQKFQLVPYEYIAEQQIEHQKLGEKLLMENQGRMFREQLQKQEQQKQNDQLKQQQEQQKIKELEKVTHLDMIKQQQDLKFQYAPSFNDHRYTSDIQNTLKSLHLDNLKAKADAEAIANSSPMVIHKDITLKKHRPNFIIKSVNLPVPEPVMVPFPQPYPVPLEIIKPYAVPVVKTEKIEVEKPVPIEVEKRIPVEVERKIYVKVDKPYTVERIVPIQIKKEIPVEVPLYKPEKLTILKHIWQHWLIFCLVEVLLPKCLCYR